MAKQLMILILSAIFIIEVFSISSTNGASIFFFGFPIDQEASLPLPPSSIAEENIKRVHRREIESESKSMEDQPVQSELDDLETAAGTNVLRPLFVYRQQMAYRERNTRKLAAKRRAIPDTYE